MNQLDLLAVGAHPDDVELCAGGVVCKAVHAGHEVGLLDLTWGELGTRGSVETRKREAAAAADILGVNIRENLGLADGGIANDRESQLRFIRILRRYRPRILLLNAPVCRHPDHCEAAALGKDAAFFSGLAKIETTMNGERQEPWRPQHVLHYMQSVPFEPSVVVDVSEVWEQRMEALLAYESQFHVPGYKGDSNEPETYVSNPDFLEWVAARARTYGYPAGVQFAEPLLYAGGPFAIDDIVSVLGDRTFR